MFASVGESCTLVSGGEDGREKDSMNSRAHARPDNRGGGEGSTAAIIRGTN